MTTVDPLDVLEAVAGLDMRPVRLPGVTVLRTQDRPDAGVGNAVHHREPVRVDQLDEVLDDAARRFGHPQTTPRAVVHHDRQLHDAAVARADVAVSALVSAVLDEPVGTPAAWPRRDDIHLGAPTDDRGWHAVSVLHRHAAGDAEDAHGEDDDRARGGQDDRLRWWVAGQRQLVALGRARIVRAERFGTPVGTATLVWEPRVEVGQDHAGLAVITDVIVHPAHRRLGIASTMVAALLDAHLAAFPRALVATLADASLEEPLLEAGWRVDARLSVLERRG